MEKAKKTKSVRKTVSNILLAVVIAAVLAVCAVLFMGKLQNKPAFFGDKAVVWILTDSMADEIPEKTYILVEKVDAAEVEVGDVIIFTSDDPDLGGSLNTHRVVEIIGEREEFVTKGDNNYIVDEYTAKADKVWGRYVKKLPVLTAMMRFFLTPRGLIITLAAFLAITIVMFIPDFRKGMREKKKAEAEAAEEYRKERIREEVARLERENKKSQNDGEDEPEH